MPDLKPRQLGAFIHVSLDGYYCDARGDMSFAHKPPDDEEWAEFVTGNASGGRMLLFGRITYEMMASWWPTPAASKAMPDVAANMNALPKAVFSRTLVSPAWSNTILIKNDVAGTVRQMKDEPGPDLTILGSGSIVTQVAEAGLLDSLQVVINPVALGDGKALFSGLARRLDWTLTNIRAFKNGSVVLWYVPH